MDVIWTNWQDGRQPAEPFTRLSPNLQLIRDELGKRFGGTNLGGFGVRRVRGGTAWSSHSFGAAIDWRIDGNETRGAALDWLVENFRALGVQQLHDYRNSRIWRAHRYPGEPVSTWWRPQQPNASTGMGQTWALWIHVETSAGRWGDTTPISARLEPPKPEPIIFDPANGQWGLWPVAPAKPVLRRVDTPVSQLSFDATKYAQGVMRRKASQNIAVDGDFGQQTDTAVRNLQRFFKLTVDGVVGRQTWGVLDMLAGK